MGLMSTSPQTIEELIAKMEAMEADLVARNDARRYFHSTYLRTTRAVHDEHGTRRGALLATSCR